MSSQSCAASPTASPNLLALFPRATPPPTPCSVNEVVIQLTTRVLIADYDRYFAPTPIASFLPSYSTLGDGSLVATPFIDDLREANLSLLVTGMLTMLFWRNIMVSGNYIRRAKVKNKALFYLLFASQILAPACFVPDIISYFDYSLNCTLALRISRIASSISLSMLITGILGYKAYKCLENSRVVFFNLALFLCASTAISILDIREVRGSRRISGGCTRASSLIFMQAYVLVQFAEMAFISGCFFYAIYKFHKLPTTQGRLSIDLSICDEHANTRGDGSGVVTQPARRGWWDYVPEDGPSSPPTAQPTIPPQNRSRWHDLWLKVLPSRERSRSQAELLPASATEKNPRTEPSQQPSRSPSVKIATPVPRHDGTCELRRPSGRNSPAPSSFSRLSKFMPRMALFKAVLKDEIWYTAFITATCVLIAILAVIGINFKNGLTVNGWILANWGLISTLAAHSLGRVIQRNERETLLTHPSVWNSAAAASNQAGRQGRARSPTSLASRRRRSPHATRQSSDDPFADTHKLRHSHVSWTRAEYAAASSKPRSPSPAPSADSFSKDPMQVLRPSVLLTFPDDFPTSGRTTPVVRHYSSDGTSLQALHTSPTVSCVEPPDDKLEMGERDPFTAESVERVILKMADVS
ncbi:hypothetical protein HGRIS_007749 [Hohenbuehelia grisea]|uniref:Pheromone receptor n=1 Tax=Hohenbuehelia grisea TaxID=104357 RepID=A0ABR3J5U6_9AGAR